MPSAVTRFDHVSLAVRSMEAALPLYRDLLGGSYIQAGDDLRPGREFRWLTLRLPGGAKLELIEPSTPASFLHAFLDKRGEGIHHLTFEVASLEAAVADFRSRGYVPQLIDASDPHWREAFVHPRQANGVLLQLYESDLSPDELIAHYQAAWGRELMDR